MVSNSSLQIQTSARTSPSSEAGQPQAAGKHRPRILLIRQMGTKLALLLRISIHQTILRITKERLLRLASG